MIRLTTLKLVDRPDERNQLEGKLDAGTRIEVRRDDLDRTLWHLLATHALVPAPAEQATQAEQSGFRRPGEKARAAAAARDLLEKLGDLTLDDRVDDIGCGP